MVLEKTLESPLDCKEIKPVNPRDFWVGGAWWAAVYGVAQSRTRRKRLSGSSQCQAGTISSLVGALQGGTGDFP